MPGLIDPPVSKTWIDLAGLRIDAVLGKNGVGLEYQNGQIAGQDPPCIGHLENLHYTGRVNPGS